MTIRRSSCLVVATALVSGAVAVGVAGGAAQAAGALTVAVPATAIAPLPSTTRTEVHGLLPAAGGGFTVVWDEASSFSNNVGSRTYDASVGELSTRQTRFFTGFVEWRRMVAKVLPGSPDLQFVSRSDAIGGLSPGGATHTQYGFLDQGQESTVGVDVGPAFVQGRNISLDAVGLNNKLTATVITGGQNAFAGGGSDPASPDVPDKVIGIVGYTKGTTIGTVDLAAPGGPHVSQGTIAAFTDATSLALWTQDLGDANGQGVMGRRMSTTGTAIGPAFVVNQTTTGDQSDAAVTTLADGNAVVAWTDTSGLGGDASVSSIKARVVRPDGTFATPEVLVNQNVTGAQSDASVTPLLGDRLLVTWIDQGTGVRRLKARMFDGAGLPVSDEIEVANGAPTAAVGTDQELKVLTTTLTDGNVVVAWTTGTNGYVAVLDTDPALVLGEQVPFSGVMGRTAMVSLVTTENADAGYVQVLPCGTAPGATSNMNTDRPNQTRAGIAAVKFDGMGRACVYRHGTAQVVADIQGYFTAGSFLDVPDQRLLDTRSGARPGADVQLSFPGTAEQTAMISIVATENAGAGYFQVLPCGVYNGAYSNLNTDAADQTRASLAMTTFTIFGTSCVYTQQPSHVVVDLQGYLATGAFQDQTPLRVLDTRNSAKPVGGTQILIRGQSESTGVVALTATESSGLGYLQVLPCGSPPGGSSNLNIDRVGETIANLAMVHFDFGGTACVYTQATTHVVVDIQGYFTPGAFEDIPDVRALDTRLAHPQTST